jgi:hypothetical protein
MSLTLAQGGAAGLAASALPWATLFQPFRADVANFLTSPGNLELRPSATLLVP